MWRPSAGPEEAQRACERGYAVIEEPVSPEELCRRLAGLLGSPRNDALAEPRRGGGERLIPREEEVLALGSKQENGLPKEIDPWNRVKAET